MTLCLEPICQHNARSLHFANSFLIMAINDWNKFPEELVNLITTVIFFFATNNALLSEELVSANITVIFFL